MIWKIFGVAWSAYWFEAAEIARMSPNQMWRKRKRTSSTRVARQQLAKSWELRAEPYPEVIQSHRSGRSVHPECLWRLEPRSVAGQADIAQDGVVEAFQFLKWTLVLPPFANDPV
jgi:hypothetical protein